MTDEKRRSILIDARTNAVPGCEGLTRWTLKMVERMSPLPDGLTLRVLVNQSLPQLFPLDGVAARAELVDTDIVLPSAARDSRKMRSRELGRLISDLDAAVFYSVHPLFAPSICPCPMVISLFDTIYESSSAKEAGGWHMRFLQKTVTAARLRRAAAVVAPTRATLAEIKRHYPSAPRLTLVTCGVEAGQFADVTDDAVEAVRERYDLAEEFVLAVGTHRPHKNHVTLLQALPLLPPDVSLVVAGHCDPGGRCPLDQQIPALGLQDRVKLLTTVTDEELPALYRAASVFAFPSLVEGYGFPPLEAMSAGVPVVASDIPVLAETYGSGSGALLVPPQDAAAWAKALSRVLDDPATAAEMAAAGTAFAAATTWDRGAEAMRELLLSVMQ